MKDNDIHRVVEILEETVKRWKEPVVGVVARQRDPFKVLVATLLSLRTKDETTREAAQRLFARADSPAGMIELGEDAIATLIYPVGFYRNKARTIAETAGEILTKYHGSVPDTVDELLKLKGVGRKTANLVVTLAYNKPGICVDVHVHRIANRLGYIHTKNPGQTETALREKLPEKYWIRLNDILVTFGQNLCKPVSPFCSRCPVRTYCSRAGIDRCR